uniref:Hexosyltransferase n=1 Tax=Leptobrachium leishanense TaxID=445787 RepID=A0A8C5LX20_9ANUR
MALKQTCLKVLLCASAFTCLLLLWCQLPRSITELLSSSHKNGVRFNSLFSDDLQEPKCQIHQVLLVLVTTDPGHMKARRAIRRTWAAPARDGAHPWQVVFLIGRTLDVELDWHIHKEQAAHGDILMGNYLDSYRNLTLKVMHGMKWASERCRPRYILKTDDDCFVNTDRFPAFLAHHNKVQSGLYVGSVFPEKKRVVIRDPKSKWYVSREHFQLDSYPPYASGVGYVLSSDVVRKVLKMAEIITPIPVEDAYIGLLARRAQIMPLSSSRFTKNNIKWGICNYRYLMVIHRMAPGDQKLAQKNVLRTLSSGCHLGITGSSVESSSSVHHRTSNLCTYVLFPSQSTALGIGIWWSFIHCKCSVRIQVNTH